MTPERRVLYPHPGKRRTDGYELFTHKICNTCKLVKPVSEFHRILSNKNKPGNWTYYSWCKRCRKIYTDKLWADPSFRSHMAKVSKRWIRRNQSKMKLYQRRASVKHAYGITLEQYDSMYAELGGLCMICGMPGKQKKLFIDHCHKTGKVRGLLCCACNLWLGKIEKNPKILPGIINYLNKYKPVLL